MKKLLKGIIYIVGSVFLLVTAYVLISGKTYLYKALAYNFVDIDDNVLFYNREVKAGNGIEWPLSADYNKASLPQELKSELEKWESVAWLVIRNDSILYEKYWEEYNDKSLSNSFSMAKSIVGVLTGIAFDEGFIKSLDQPVADFLPEFREGKKKNITIRHLLTMCSGLDWDEAYANPLSITTEAYYGTDLYSIAVNQNVISEPGKNFIYQSGNTELLALILEQATGMTLSDYASERLWKPLHAMKDALWSLDKKDGREKAYCCFYSNARDFARIGTLYLHNGNLFGRQIVSPSYVMESVAPAPLLDEGRKNESYGFHWWLLEEAGEKMFYMRGILGQYVVVIPGQNIVFVRLGHKRAEKNAAGVPADLPVYVRGALQIANTNGNS